MGIYDLRRFLIISTWLLFLSGDCNRRYPPNTGTYKVVRQSLLEHLDKEVLPFWVSTKVNNEAWWGYLPFLDGNLRPTGKVQEHVVVQLRMLYVHAVAVSRTTDLDLKAELLRRYQGKFAFLKRQYLDEMSGGFFDSSYDTRAGSTGFLKGNALPSTCHQPSGRDLSDHWPQGSSGTRQSYFFTHR